MKSGDTFWLTDKSVEGGHPRFVLSDTDQDSRDVVVASLTGWEANKDQSCVLEAGEDTIVVKKSIVSYRDAIIVRNDFLDKKVAEGALACGPPLSAATLAKIRAGCAVTRCIPQDVFEMLDQQGLIPIV